MNNDPATAIAHPNIALIKYWGDLDADSHIPANGSISMNLSGLTTRTRVSFDPALQYDELILNEKPLVGNALQRIRTILNTVRRLAGIPTFARVESKNNFPTGAGIASSASGFAALSLAASKAAGLELNERELSRLARTGSGSACRSIPGGFVEWQAGTNDADSFAYSFASPDYWDIADCIAVVSQNEKSVSSTEGHSLALTSMLQPIRIADTPHRLDICRTAILSRDFTALADIVELDSNLMHAVMITSHPPLLYWQPATVAIMQAVRGWRDQGLPVCYTIDAGPNVHLICPGDQADIIADRLRQIPAVIDVLISHPGEGVRLVSTQPDQAETSQ
jgi:diphosphomevalonate decarboxylase